MSNSVLNNLYKDVKNTMIVSSEVYRILYVEFQDKMKTWTDTSKGYICNKRSLLGLEIESSVWCESNYAYLFDGNGDVHTIIINLDDGTFKKEV